MKKRVYGIAGISSIMANWNADFSGYPKTNSSRKIFGSDKAFKYPMKKMWENQGKNVLYIKSMRFEEDKTGIHLIPRTLKERYEQLFSVEDLKQENDGKRILENLFKAIDVKNFGATFAEAGNNISITGAVQFGQGFNKYEESQAFDQPILSPFRDPNAKEKSLKKSSKKQDENADENGDEGKEARNSTIGTKIISDEAHYFYSFSIDPAVYKDFIELGVTDGYTEDDYCEFKKASMTAATSYATNSKAGCENEFSMFVETDEDVYLPNMAEHIVFEKGEKKNKVMIDCSSLLNEAGKGIQNVEIYYNPYTIEIEHDIIKAKLYDIFTQKEI